MKATFFDGQNLILPSDPDLIERLSALCQDLTLYIERRRGWISGPFNRVEGNYRISLGAVPDVYLIEEIFALRLAKSLIENGELDIQAEIREFSAKYQEKGGFGTMALTGTIEKFWRSLSGDWCLHAPFLECELELPAIPMQQASEKVLV